MCSFQKLTEEYKTFTSEEQGTTAAMVTHFQGEFPALDESFIMWGMEKSYIHDNDSITIKYAKIHRTLNFYMERAEWTRGDPTYCKGHQIYNIYDAGTCLECGEGFCHCMHRHCCCKWDDDPS